MTMRECSIELFKNGPEGAQLRHMPIIQIGTPDTDKGWNRRGSGIHWGLDRNFVFPCSEDTWL